MNASELADTVGSSIKLEEIRDALRDLHGKAEYLRRVDRYIDLVGGVMQIHGSSALYAATEIAGHALEMGQPRAASWVLAAAVEPGEWP